MFNKLYYAYFEWLKSQIGERVQYSKLMEILYNTPFHYIHPLDKNRYDDGLYMRHRFAMSNDIPFEVVKRSEATNMPCSILEMMVALASRCEDSIMSDDELGNRTGVWFWEMIDAMGLSGFTDDRIAYLAADPVFDILQRFNSKKYKPNGDGGLFRTSRKDIDMRDLEIWDQAMLHLNEVLARQG